MEIFPVLGAYGLSMVPGKCAALGSMEDVRLECMRVEMCLQRVRFDGIR